MHAGKEVMKGTFPPFAAFNPDQMRGDPIGVEFHPGALKAFEELGL
jgi:hypothetical protein